ncbi:MAG: hypothetical protein HOM33_08935 [Halieaceae bacterium]|jgi:hypothetical protein|nr:hypothetical protein [Halieaceae bacterium]MBT5556120.1 hypothetical protein [Halieaceae bacterium]
MADLIPILGILCGIIIPLAAFYWQYLEGKEKRELVVEIAKHNDDPIKISELMALLEEPKQEPVDYRRGGVITLCVGIGVYLLGKQAFGSLFIGIGLLVAAIGLGILIAGYLYPKTSQELTNAVDEFEKR